MQDLRTSDHQEWQLGIQFGYQFGYRQGWDGIRNAKLQLARERAVLREQEIAISHGLSDAIAELSRAHGAVRINYSRLQAATQRREATETRFQVAKPEQRQQLLNLLLQSQQRLADAQSRYFLSLAQYAKAVKDVHRQKGTLLPYNGIHLSEGPWPAKAYADAKEIRRRWRPTKIDYRIHHQPGTVSKGVFAQRTAEHAHVDPSSVVLPGVVPLGAGPDSYEFVPPHDDDPSLTDRNGKQWKTIVPSFFLPKPTYRAKKLGNPIPITHSIDRKRPTISDRDGKSWRPIVPAGGGCRKPILDF
jgi:hypothetical protein